MTIIDHDVPDRLRRLYASPVRRGREEVDVALRYGVRQACRLADGQLVKSAVLEEKLGGAIGHDLLSFEHVGAWGVAERLEADGLLR
jgi:hypothetical protein